MSYHLIQMSEPRNIIEVIDFLRTLHKPSEFDFSRANLKPNKEKRFMAFIHSLHMSPSEAIRIITHLTKEELVKGPSPAKMTERTPFNLVMTKDRWIFKHNHIYDEVGHSVTIVIYIKIIINDLNQRLVVVESFHQDM